jgi:hypothetical protein
MSISAASSIRAFPLLYRHILSFLFATFFFFLIAFPKGGFKIGEVPITWGYLFLGLFFLASFFKTRFVYSRRRILAFLAILPFGLLGMGAIGFHGAAEGGFAVSFFICFIFLPAVFFFSFSPHLEAIESLAIEKMTARALFFVSLFGVIAFFYTVISQDFLLIPHLMIPAEDIEDFALKRMIDRGSFFKLVSTYNNGNIYGICMLMFLNYYFHIEKTFLKRATFILSLILTLSRTVWLGLLIATCVGFFLKPKKKSNLLKYFVFWILSIGSIWLALQAIEFDWGFLFDTNLGGRLWQFETLRDFSLLPSTEFQTIWEIVYLGILQNFGLIGMLLFIMGMLTPLALYFLGSRGGKSCQSSVQNRIAAGLITYLIVCWSDGAIQFIPTMALYWFLSSMLLSPSTKFLRVDF